MNGARHCSSTLPPPPCAAGRVSDSISRLRVERARHVRGQTEKKGKGLPWLWPKLATKRESPRDYRAICEPTITVFSLGSWKASTGLVAFLAIPTNSFLRQARIGGASVGLIAIRETK